MKLNIKYKLFTAVCLFALISFSSCVKNRPGETDFGGLQPVVLIPEGGLAAFGSQAVTFPSSDTSDSLSFRLNYAATNVAPANETITLGIDTAAMDAYNATGGVQYVLAPDSIYSFTTTSVTVPAGGNYSDPVKVVVYPGKVDPTKNYMIPISIKAGPKGAIISGNFGTIYYHFIGNPLAGTYVYNYFRFNAPDTTGTPTTTATYTQVFLPDDPNTIEVQTGYGDQNGFNYRYVLTFDGSGTNLTNFSITMNSNDVSSVKANTGITLTKAPAIIVADPVHKHFRFTYGVTNAAGGIRTFIDDYQR